MECVRLFWPKPCMDAHVKTWGGGVREQMRLIKNTTKSEKDEIVARSLGWFKKKKPKSPKKAKQNTKFTEENGKRKSENQKNISNIEATQQLTHCQPPPRQQADLFPFAIPTQDVTMNPYLARTCVTARFSHVTCADKSPINTSRPTQMKINLLTSAAVLPLFTQFSEQHIWWSHILNVSLFWVRWL